MTESALMSDDTPSPLQLKAALRRAALARREELPPDQRQAAGLVVAERGLPIEVVPGAIVSGFSPMKSEISPLPLLRRLADAGLSLALPVVTGRGQPLVMRAWSFGTPLVSGVWGIREPPADAPELYPDILIVPLLAFDRRGYRLGYGGGYYDRTIARLRTMKPVTAVGIAFSAQQIEDVPITPRDERLDLVLTEAGTIDFRT
jgi:5-formyltetrahydrofolate cyclo-ligase